MFLGIEIGGTKLQIGLGEGTGSLRGLWRATVNVVAGAEGIRRQILQGVPELLGQAAVQREAVRGIGIGFGGPISDDPPRVIKSHQIEGWDDFPLADWISEMLGWPAVLGNDADVAGLAEALFGAGKGLSPIFYMTIGSGIGGGLIIDGDIYRGTGRGAAEIGHLRIYDSKSRQVCSLEQLASGWAIAHAPDVAPRSRRAGADVLIPALQEKHPGISAADVARAAADGNAAARHILDSAWEALAEGICHVIALLSPRRIIIGGGVSLMGQELLFKPLRLKVARRVFKPFASSYDIVPAALGEEVVVHGALALTRKRLG